jgi:hypothetical protein
LTDLLLRGTPYVHHFFALRRFFRHALSARARLALIVLFVVAQAAAISHVVQHAAQGDSGGCETCIAAGHSGHAVFHRPVIAADFCPTVAEVAERLAPQPCSALAVAYRSRAPPVSA